MRLLWLSLGMLAACQSSPTSGDEGDAPPDPPQAQAVVVDGALQCKDNAAPAALNGTVACVLANDQVFAGLTCKAGLLAELYDSGKLKRCTTSTPKQWHDIPCNPARPVSFHPDGSFASCVVPDTHPMGEFVCQYQIDVHPDGSLAGCRVARDMVVAGQALVARTQVIFDATGKMRKLVLPPDRPRAHGDKSCGEVELDDDGAVVGCVDAIVVDPSAEEQRGTP